MQGVDVNGVNIGGVLVLLALAVIATNVCLEHSPMPPLFSAKAAGYKPHCAADLDHIVNVSKMVSISSM